VYIRVCIHTITYTCIHILVCLYIQANIVAISLILVQSSTYIERDMHTYTNKPSKKKRLLFLRFRASLVFKATTA